MADNMECDVCGGRDFYKESGYYYCNECQTQSQDLREHVFEDEIIDIKSTRKIKKAETEKRDSQVTSWECYNIVMFSLTEQLINLGARKNLKSIIKCLWMRYLQKLEVFNLTADVKPKLQLVNSKRDLNILSGTSNRKQKRKRTKSSDESCISLDSSRPSKREFSKKKRKLVEAHYEEFSQRSKYSSEKSDETEQPILFNRYSKKEIKRKRGIIHLDRPMFLTTNRSDKLSYKNCSEEYRKGVHYLSPVKLYCILYLGLLINRDKIQLGDLFRYIREGHITFNNFTKLFPEEYLNKYLNIQNNSNNHLFSNGNFRQTSAKLAKFLCVTKYIRVVDLSKLCQRYCNELNLPEEICTSAKRILSWTKPKLAFTNKSLTIPNYEGRVMSIILFVLKLLYGLDGVTEWKLSEYAQSVNDMKINKPKMFDIIKWVEYITYRSLIISQHHFPSMHLKDSEHVDSDLFLSWIQYQGAEPDENNVKLTKEMADYKELLSKIIQCEEDHKDNDNIKFRPSLTPFLDYSLMLNSVKYNLHQSFQDDSLEFLLRPNKYLLLVNDSFVVKHGGANDNWVVEEIKTYRKINSIADRDLKPIPVQVMRDVTETTDSGEDDVSAESKTATVKLEPSSAEKSRKSKESKFKDNEIYVERLSKQVKFKSNIKIKKKSNSSQIHYNPYERYWLHLQMNIDSINKNHFDEYFKKHASEFKLICNECARILEQTPAEFLHEFVFSELFLVYSSSFSEKRRKKQKLDVNLRCYANQAEAHW